MEGGRGVCGGMGRGVWREREGYLWRRGKRCVQEGVDGCVEEGEGCAKKEGEADREACRIDGRKSVEWEGSEGEQEGTCRKDWREITS